MVFPAAIMRVLGSLRPRPVRPAPPCARTRRCRPVRGSASAVRRRLRRRFRRRGCIGPGCMTRHSGAALCKRCIDRPKRSKYSASEGIAAACMRSFCRRNMIATFAPSSAASKSSNRRQCANSSTSGSSCAGAHTRRSRTPSARNACTSERATREWRIRRRSRRATWKNPDCAGAASARRAGLGSGARDCRRPR